MNVICSPGAPIGANSYLVSDDNGNAVLIDPTDASVLADLLRANGLHLAAILLTHGHFDHTFAQNRLKSEFSVPSYLHAADTGMINDPHKNASDLAGNLFANHPFGTADILLHGGETLTFDSLIFRVHHTPGHTEGSVCYECESCLFSGDTLFHGSAGRTDLYGGNPASLRDSLHYISSLDHIEKIYPGHGPETTLKYERIMNPHLQ